MNNLFIMLFLFIFTVDVRGSTFVGNGGSALDTELTSTLGRLKESLQASSSDEQLCKCAGESSQCAVLKDLNPEQVKYCKKFVDDMAEKLLSVMKDRDLRFKWSSAVSSQDRSFDAITILKTKTIVIDERRFASIGTADRVQLMAHELLHLLSYEGLPLVDEGKRGPFTTEQGGRQLLDSAGAAYVIVGMRADAIPLIPSNISRPFKNLFLNISNGHRSLDGALQKSRLMDHSIDVTNFEATWFPRLSDNVGYSLGVYEEGGEFRRDFWKVKSRLSLSAATVGVKYRYSPFQTQETWLDSVQLQGSVRLGGGFAKASIEDEFVKVSDETRLFLFEARIDALVPLLWNFWLTLSRGEIYAPFKSDKLNIESKSFNATNYVGVAYGIAL